MRPGADNTDCNAKDWLQTSLGKPAKYVHVVLACPLPRKTGPTHHDYKHSDGQRELCRTYWRKGCVLSRKILPKFSCKLPATGYQ